MGRWLWIVGVTGGLLVASSAAAKEGHLTLAGGAVDLRVPRVDSPLKRFGNGFNASIGYYEIGEETDHPGFGFGFDFLIVVGDDDRMLVTGALQLMVSWPITAKALQPFIDAGIDAGAINMIDDGGERVEGATVGAHADIGIHGIVIEHLFYRLRVGVLGVGITAARTEFSFGHAF